ncbi:hypothetical protein BDZ91DRAFT_712805 [Kalaharituber pfeilii]|nr:hypothetical protein BDZ91DRAFT_712805 [Kalaharituber pfeilii]
MEDRHWIYQLPENAHLKHTVSALSTQRSPMKRQRIQNENSPKMKANGQKGPKTGLRTGKLLFGNRPVLKDIVNDIGIFEQ